LSDSSCKICGGPAPSGQRYCSGCDFQTGPEPPARGSSKHSGDRPRERERGALSVFVLVFLLASGGTVGMGLTASDGFSLPAIRQTLGLDGHASDTSAAARTEWGEVRFVHSPTRIRAGRGTDTPVVGSLMPGDSVRADRIENGWYAIFPTGATETGSGEPIGYVYAPLLKPSPPGGV
jgi:hypothetical protein